MSENIYRIKFYGVNDMTTGLHLAEAETKLSQLDLSVPITDINDALELYNIVEMFKAEVRLARWADSDYNTLRKSAFSLKSVLGRYFSSITNDNIHKILLNVATDYIDDFWAVFAYYKLYTAISNEVFEAIISVNASTIRIILKHRKIVERYSPIISENLLASEQNAEILIAHFLSSNRNAHHESIFLPVEFSSEKREKLINLYINWPNANPNYLKLVFDSRDKENLPLSINTKREAQKQYDSQVKTMFPVESSHRMELSISVSFDPETEEPIKVFDYSVGRITIVFGQKWIDSNLDYATLLNNFIYLFGFVDMQFRCSFPANPANQTLLEQLIGPRGKQTYFMGSTERFINSMYSLMLLSYQHELELRNIRIEKVIEWFFSDYLPEEFAAHNFVFNPPSVGTTDLEKCKMLVTEIDSILKQFDLFAREGSIDRELFELKTESLKLGKIQSMIPQKYFYSKSDECNFCSFCLFSDQSSLSYTQGQGYKNKYRTLYDLLKNQQISLDDFRPYQKSKIGLLFTKKCLILNEKSLIELVDGKVTILHELYKKQYCCTSYLSDYKKEIQEMSDSEDIRFTSAFFAEPEKDYLNYVFTKFPFANGLDLRNKYVHGNYPVNPAQHGKDYLEFLKILIVIVIKINEEFCLREDLANLQTNKLNPDVHR